LARVRRKFSDEFKQEAVRLVTVRGVSMAQAARDLSLHVNLLRTWVRTATSDAAAAIGQPSAKAEQAELTRLRKEVATLRMERDICASTPTFPQFVNRQSPAGTPIRMGGILSPSGPPGWG
jgi:transposase